MLAKAPNRKRAEQYLAASGAVPISIKTDGTDSFAKSPPGRPLASSRPDGGPPNRMPRA
jgi:hypothetical protein